MNLALRTQFIVASLLITTAGCVPYPHRAFTSPEISGVLMSNGRPLEAAAVMIGDSNNSRNPCQDAELKSSTMTQGHFSVAQQSDLEWYWAFIDPFQSARQLTNLCFEVEGQNVLGAQITTPVTVPTTFSVTCDTATPVDSFDDDSRKAPGAPRGICRLEHRS